MILPVYEKLKMCFMLGAVIYHHYPCGLGKDTPVVGVGRGSHDPRYR